MPKLKPLTVLFMTLSLSVLSAGRPAETGTRQETVAAEGRRRPAFSFVYDGQPSRSLLSAWTSSESRKSMGPRRMEVTRSYLDPKTGLDVRCVAVEYGDFPAVEWTVHFTNKGRKKDPLLWDIPQGPGSALVFYRKIGQAASRTAPGPIRMEDAEFDSNGVKIRYVTAGAGEPVVLIHGWMADSSMWGRDSSGNTRLNAGGAEGFQLIALDCRGHGRSGKPHDPAKYGPEMAADVVRLLDHLKIEKAHLIGYSSGAFIAGKVAATHPKRVLSVVYAGQAPLVAGAKSSGSSEVEIFARAVDEGLDLGTYIIAVTPPGRPKPTDDQAKAMAKFLFGGKDVKAFAAAGRSFGDLEVTRKQLRRCEAPILFIHGGNETDYVKDRVAAVRAMLGRGEVRIIEGADHMTTLIRPEFSSAVMGFLRSGKAK